jgi:SagB-type dehydrogenase family enzyme
MKKKQIFIIITAITLIVVLSVLSACDKREPGESGEPVSEIGEISQTSQTDTAAPEIVETQESQPFDNSTIYTLPAPKKDGDFSVESALENRRSRRNFTAQAITQEQLSQILWAAYGITSDSGLRTAPSAGVLYPLEIYAVIGNVDRIVPGVYRYVAENHEIIRVVEGDVRSELAAASLGQNMVAQAPMSVFYSAVFERTAGRYGERGENYVYIEVGHSAQNVYLQAEALGLGTCAIGAFTDDSVREILRLPAEETPMYLMPVGYFE